MMLASKVSTVVIIFTLSIDSDGLLLDATDTFSILNFNSGKAILTPVGAPRVLDDPVVSLGAFVVTITNSESEMVGFSAAVVGSEDATSVVFEANVASIHLDSERTRG